MTVEDRALTEVIGKTRSMRLKRLLDDEIDAMVDGFYAADARLMPPDQPTLEGRDAILAFWKQAPASGLVSLELNSREVVGSGELAYERGDFARTLRPQHGHPFRDLGKYLVVYRRQKAGDYRAVVEMFNTPRGR